MASPLKLAVGPRPLKGGLLTNFEMYPFDYTAFAVSGKVTGLTTLVGWLSLPQLTVLGQFSLVV